MRTMKAVPTFHGKDSVTVTFYHLTDDGKVDRTRPVIELPASGGLDHARAIADVFNEHDNEKLRKTADELDRKNMARKMLGELEAEDQAERETRIRPLGEVL